MALVQSQCMLMNFFECSFIVISELGPVVSGLSNRMTSQCHQLCESPSLP